MENRIMVIDNDPAVLEAIELSLTYCGFQVRSLLSGENFFPMLADFDPHLVIVDYQLRGYNGGEICMKLKSDPQTCIIPVILLSAHPEAGLMIDKYNFDEFLSKPFDLSVLLNKIYGFINQNPVID